MNEGSNHVEEIIRICQEANQQLLIAMPWWADDETGIRIRQEVVTTAHRGIDVRVQIRPDHSNRRTIEVLKNCGVHVTALPQLHGKAVCSEQEHAHITLNFFNKDALRNINFAEFCKDQDKIEDFSNQFREREHAVSEQLDGPELHTDVKDLVEEIAIQRTLPYSRLNPLQSLCTRHALYGEENLLVIAPTGAGKTLVGILGLLSASIRLDAKAVWLVPSRALAKEITKSLKNLSHPKIKSLELLGGDDAHNELLEKHNLWICTTEKYESILRRQSANRITTQVYTIVIDEIHLLADRTRGALLESIIARIKDQAPYPRIIGLSATLDNEEEFAGWFNARVLKSTWKPSSLNKEVICYQGDRRENFLILDKRREQVLTQTLRSINNDSQKKGATLVFCRSKRKCFKQAISLLRDLTEVEDLLDRVDTKQPPSNEASDLLLRNRIGMHFNGYSKSIESLQRFNDSKIDFLFSTTGLAQGVNTKAKTVIISETTLGWNEPLGINTANQMLGRAGRGEGNEGWGIIICPEYEKEKWSEGIEKSSRVKSGMSNKLVEVILAEIALQNIQSGNEAKTWYSKTFQAFCDQESREIEHKIEKTISFLLQEGLVLLGDDGGLEVSNFGFACIRLMTDIDSSINLVKTLHSITPSQDIQWNEMQLVLAVSQAIKCEEFSALKELASFAEIANACISRYRLAENRSMPDFLLNLIAIDLLLYNKDKIDCLPEELSGVKDRCLYYIPETAPRYLALINQIGALASSPWITMCANDVSKRISWHRLLPKPERGASRMIGFIESLSDPLLLKSKLQEAWKSAQDKHILTPDRIPEGTTSFSFCTNKAKAQDGMHNIFHLDKLTVEFIDSDDIIRVSNFPEGTLETFARVDSSCGSNQKYLGRATTLEIKLPITNKETEDYSILVYSATRNDRILFSETLKITKEIDCNPENQLLNMFKALSSSLPQVAIARKQHGLRKFLREKLLGPLPHSDEFAEAIAKKDYLVEIASIFRLANDTDVMTAWRINDLINESIELRPSLNSAPFEFQSVANTITHSAGTILDREITKASLGINCGLDMGLAYNSNGGSVYALLKHDSGWGLFQNIPFHHAHHLKAIFPETLAGSIQAMARPTQMKETSTPCYAWANAYSSYKEVM
ncbi:DEAD/DEAH box helicase [Cyanobium gracile UHCC 0139]|uniref:DEAD/DEAH box helicase n=1 Tax=Cyanobium gracile UHCC 0139 TaxID=3110308 RepID=A0ABU5RWE7_9CYAN|nr:DEAD/DEAH box helicase [Cyanobium gracile]MEA5392114.1 DEAD/DEAH box helicase [Cyanobium gracile UHCC 0139]